jgi:hypothetical protein
MALEVLCLQYEVRDGNSPTAKGRCHFHFTGVLVHFPFTIKRVSTIKLERYV